MAKREKGSCGRVHAWACAVSASRSLELLPRKIALKFNFRRLKLYRAIVVLNTAPPRLPPPARKGGLPPYVDYTGMCRWTGYGFWSVGYGQYDRHSISFFCPKHGQGVKPAESPLHPNIDQKSPFLLPPPREWRDSAEPRLRDAECHEVSVAKITEHSNSRTKCNTIICSGC